MHTINTLTENVSMPSRTQDLRHIGGLLFIEDTHTYYNAQGEKYTGMTTFLHKFQTEEFDSEGTARYKAIKELLSKEQFDKLKKSITQKLNEPSYTAWTKVSLFFDKLSSEKYLGQKLILKKNEILTSWDNSSLYGSIEHDKREKSIIQNGFVWNGKHYPYANKNILEITKDDVCVVPEIMVWNHNLKLCGLIDVLIADKGILHILDFKTNKSIDKTSFGNKKMKHPFNKYPDCNYTKYSAQLHGYLKMSSELLGFKKGKCVIINTANVEYGRKSDVYIECLDLSCEMDLLFDNDLTL